METGDQEGVFIRVMEREVNAVGVWQGVKGNLYFKRVLCKECAKFTVRFTRRKDSRMEALENYLVKYQLSRI